MTTADTPASPPRARSSRGRWTVAALIGLGGLAGVSLAWWGSLRTYHYATVQPGVLYRDGLQSFSQFQRALSYCKAKTIVSLIDERELSDPAKPQFAWEKATFSQPDATSRLEYISIKLGGWPSDADLQRFLAICTDPAQQPVLVHCAQGVRRTGMMVAAFQMSVLGYDKERARSSMLSFGHSSRTTRDIERFIDAYDPVNRRLTQTFEPSKE